MHKAAGTYPFAQWLCTEKVCRSTLTCTTPTQLTFPRRTESTTPTNTQTQSAACPSSQSHLDDAVAGVDEVFQRGDDRQPRAHRRLQAPRNWFQCIYCCSWACGHDAMHAGTLDTSIMILQKRSCAVSLSVSLAITQSMEPRPQWFEYVVFVTLAVGNCERSKSSSARLDSHCISCNHADIVSCHASERCAPVMGLRQQLDLSVVIGCRTNCEKCSIIDPGTAAE